MIQSGTTLPLYTTEESQTEKVELLITGRKTSVRPVSGNKNRDWVANLQANRQIMKNAVAYAASGNQQNRKTEAYQSVASEKGNCSATSLMVRDFFRPPVIEEISFTEFTGEAGNEIWVTAKDDFKVERVQVGLLGPDGTALASGAALETADGRWRFKLPTTLPLAPTLHLVAEAFDIPGNCGWLELELELNDSGAYEVKV